MEKGVDVAIATKMIELAYRQNATDLVGGERLRAHISQPRLRNRKFTKVYDFAHVDFRSAANRTLLDVTMATKLTDCQSNGSFLQCFQW